MYKWVIKKLLGVGTVDEYVESLVGKMMTYIFFITSVVSILAILSDFYFNIGAETVELIILLTITAAWVVALAVMINMNLIKKKGPKTSTTKMLLTSILVGIVFFLITFFLNHEKLLLSIVFGIIIAVVMFIFSVRNNNFEHSKD
ncbi:hypothetical protein [Companilactobacillus mishanensis]|uniref:Uncharacterized protein n=1 Tax=Companilactobacillus mishanensis TaxID=2486008 RepID=A0A5P0ZJS6_9LACO|nr:hypothetical protein [Companilactobacillus mishanensis]MQS53361.1 hypothetical protein [Companilactobacillus mishanensis]